MPIPFKKDPMEFKQRALFATNVFDLLPSDHPCYVYEDIFEQLDTSSVEEKIQRSWSKCLSSETNKHSCINIYNKFDYSSLL